MVKIDIKYYDHEPTLIESVIVHEMAKGFLIPTSLRSSRISVRNNVIDEELSKYLRDYDVPASKEEWKKFLKKIIVELY